MFGINPSTATKEKNDTTISISEKIAKMRNCDGYLISNIYPVRETNIGKKFLANIDQNIFKVNLQHISEHIEDSAELIAAWGTHIKDSKFFIEMIEQINNIAKDKNAKWI